MRTTFFTTLMLLACLATGACVLEPTASPNVEIAPDIAPSDAKAGGSTEESTDPLPIFDTHVHYSQDAWSAFSPADIIAMMERVHVPHAIVSSTPDEGTRMLYAEDPVRIIPFLRAYHGDANSSNWYLDPDMLNYLSGRLETHVYEGIGEFHIHSAGDADLPLIRSIAEIAVERDFYLSIHTDASSVRAVFEHTPNAKILWAHAGMSEPPDVVSAMMDEYANLWTDISYREHAIAPDGILNPAWEALFLRHPDRITIGSDTWITPRWRTYEQIIEFDRAWLAQLPRKVAEQIAFGNAERLFGRE